MADLFAQKVEVRGEHQPSSCAYSTLNLNETIPHTSTEMAKAQHRMKCSLVSSASECNISPMSEYNGIRIKKYAAVEATEEAVQAIADRNNHLHECEELDCLSQLKEKIEQYEQKADMYKAKYKKAKRKLSGVRLKTILRCIKMKYESTKRAKKRYDTEFIVLKNKRVGNLLLCQRIPCLIIPCLQMNVAIVLVMTNHKFVLMHL